PLFRRGSASSRWPRTSTASGAESFAVTAATVRAGVRGGHHPERLKGGSPVLDDAPTPARGWNPEVGPVAAVFAVDPVPWARAQMAFTLAAHIILVPLGVSWAFMTLIANHRGLKRDDPDAMLLAQRWSRYMAVTFAVGAVTGTVLSFEF